MIHQNTGAPAPSAAAAGDANGSSSTSSQQTSIKQVEFNTYSCAGAAHANAVANMHRYLASRGAYTSWQLQAKDILENQTTACVVDALKSAHLAYGPPVSQAKQTAVLMTVQGNNVNICDERPIEYGLSFCDPPILLHRVRFGQDILSACALGPQRELLFKDPLSKQLVEVSLVYHRAGYDENEYDVQGIQARLLLERSRAIKCPSVLSHIAGLKKIQQELCLPGVLERFIGDSRQIELLRSSFGQLYPLDMSPTGRRGRSLAMDLVTAENHILKPSLEGGGHNIYGADIPKYLSRVPPNHWPNFILMERIRGIPAENILTSQQGLYEGAVVSELGIYGFCLWAMGEQAPGSEPVINRQIGWTFKSKPVEVHEISVVKGYGSFDTPCLV